MIRRYDGRVLTPQPGHVHVWWADSGVVDVAWLALLDPAERMRYEQYRRDEDRRRFLIGTAMVRRLFAADLGVSPAEIRLDRHCPDCDRAHGKVRLAVRPGSARQHLEVSISHSGRWVVVAACRAHSIGVDVERIDVGVDYEQIGRIALTEAEARALRCFVDVERPAAFTRWWVRKEAVVKATGDGLRTPLIDFAVSSADAPSAVVAWPARPDLVDRIQLHDLPCDHEHQAALAVLDAAPVEVLDRDARELLAG
jgi:4'-phosphopantetheinyl transferase